MNNILEDEMFCHETDILNRVYLATRVILLSTQFVRDYHCPQDLVWQEW